MAEENKNITEEKTGAVVEMVKAGFMIGEKVGMTQIFDTAGNMVPVSVVKVGPCFITQIKTMEKDGYTAVQVGYGQSKKINKPARGHLKNINVRHLFEFTVEKVDGFKVGQSIAIDSFAEGDGIVIRGNSIGKGFAGTIKRHHHHRGPMSHGSKSHRITGSIGAGTTPGRVFKGRKMSGRMGGGQVTVPGLRVIKVETEKNFILVSGSVPGKKGNIVRIEKG